MVKASLPKFLERIYKMIDTISAIATPAGEGGLCVIRLSGENSLTITEKIFFLSNGKRFQERKARYVYFGKIVDPKTKRPVDEVILTYFKAPKSYTCEDVVEITAHGGTYVASRILQVTLDNGARLAEPGEFTKRAFLNGRLDLSQAEAVSDVISAASESALQSALGQLQGKLSVKISELYERLVATLAQLETAIDFPEEGLEVDQRKHLQKEISSIVNELIKLADTWRQGKIKREGVRAVLIGKPNVGKSSLLNALLKEERAIVTPHPGTTRDLLEERICIKDIHVVFVDSAGLRSNPEPVEVEGIARALSALEQADLALLLFDGSQNLDESDFKLICSAREKPFIAIVNKFDLSEKWDLERLPIDRRKVFRISAKTGTGVPALLEAIHKIAIKMTPDALVIASERHRYQLMQASSALNKTLQSFREKLSEEFIAADIQQGLNHLGMILGKTFEDDLLDKIFQEFCIGK